MVETSVDLPVCLSREHCIYKLLAMNEDTVTYEDQNGRLRDLEGRFTTIPEKHRDFYCKFANKCTMQGVKT